jgi:hypothetical protein
MNTNHCRSLVQAHARQQTWRQFQDGRRRNLGGGEREFWRVDYYEMLSPDWLLASFCAHRPRPTSHASRVDFTIRPTPDPMRRGSHDRIWFHQAEESLVGYQFAQTLTRSARHLQIETSASYSSAQSSIDQSSKTGQAATKRSGTTRYERTTSAAVSFLRQHDCHQ